MGDDKNRQGFWYWLTLSDPTYYFIAKALGGDAEKQADEAMEALAPITGVFVILCLLGLVVFGIGRLFGFW